VAQGGVGTKRARTPERKPQLLTQTRSGEIPELHDRILARAYEIFEERGRASGHDLEDWLQAEQEILGDRMDADVG
jgi:hypothetical protein